MAHTSNPTTPLIVGSISLASHLTDSSSTVSMRQCKQCAMNFLTKGELRNHRHRKCNKTTVVQYQLIKSLLREDDGYFHCPYCSFITDHTVGMNTHSQHCSPPTPNTDTPSIPATLKRKHSALPWEFSDTESLTSCDTSISEDETPKGNDNLKPLPPFHNTLPYSADYPDLVTLRLHFTRPSHSLTEEIWPYRRSDKPQVRIDYFKHVGYGPPPSSLPGIPGDIYLDFTTSDYPIVYVYQGDSGWWCYNEGPVVDNDRKRWLGVVEHPYIDSRYLWATATQGVQWVSANSFQSSSLCSRNDDREDAKDWYTRFLCDAFQMLSGGARRDWTRLPSTYPSHPRRRAEILRRTSLKQTKPQHEAQVQRDDPTLDDVRLTRNNLTSLRSPSVSTSTPPVHDKPPHKKRKSVVASELSSIATFTPPPTTASTNSSIPDPEDEVGSPPPTIAIPGDIELDPEEEEVVHTSFATPMHFSHQDGIDQGEVRDDTLHAETEFEKESEELQGIITQLKKLGTSRKHLGQALTQAKGEVYKLKRDYLVEKRKKGLMEDKVKSALSKIKVLESDNESLRAKISSTASNGKSSEALRREVNSLRMENMSLREQHSVQLRDLRAKLAESEETQKKLDMLKSLLGSGKT